MLNATNYDLLNSQTNIIRKHYTCAFNEADAPNCVIVFIDKPIKFLIYYSFISIIILTFFLFKT